MMAKICNCPRCNENSKLQKRLFSDTALAALISWGDLEEHLISEAICDSCYKELRDVLIDCADQLTEIQPMKLTKAS